MRNDDQHDPYPQHSPGFSCPQGLENHRDAVAWKEKHPDEYGFMVANALRLYRKNGYVSVNYLVNMVRNELLVGVKNGLAPAFARLIEADVPELAGCFTKHAANVDGCVR